jgi:hypothetical protein
MILEFDEDSQEFEVDFLYNFENQLELEDSGKRFPVRGKIRRGVTESMVMIGYISDDHTWVSMELRKGGRPPEEIKRSMSNVERQGGTDEEEGNRKMKEGYLNVWSKMEQVEEYLKPV